jgi:hypothetical protein
MKKTIPFLVLIGFVAVGLLLSCDKKNTVEPDGSIKSIDTFTVYEPKDTVAIYLASVRRKENNGKYSYHLSMFDANGDWRIDSLVTVYRMNLKHPRPGNIMWIKALNGGIKRITEIVPVKGDSSEIFKYGTFEHPHGVWNLTIPEDIITTPGERKVEKYIIKYIPKDKIDTLIIIDPYLRIPD